MLMNKWEGTWIMHLGKQDVWKEVLFKRQRDLRDTLGTVSCKRTLTEDAHGLAALGERGGE